MKVLNKFKANDWIKCVVLDKENKELTKNLAEFDIEIVSLDLMKPETIEPAMENIDGVFQVAAVYKSWAKNPEDEIINPSIIGGINESYYFSRWFWY